MRGLDWSCLGWGLLYWRGGRWRRWWWVRSSWRRCGWRVRRSYRLVGFRWWGWGRAWWRRRRRWRSFNGWRVRRLLWRDGRRINCLRRSSRWWLGLHRGRGCRGGGWRTVDFSAWSNSPRSRVWLDCLRSRGGLHRTCWRVSILGRRLVGFPKRVNYRNPRWSWVTLGRLRSTLPFNFRGRVTFWGTCEWRWRRIWVLVGRRYVILLLILRPWHRLVPIWNSSSRRWSVFGGFIELVGRGIFRWGFWCCVVNIKRKGLGGGMWWRFARRIGCCFNIGYRRSSSRGRWHCWWSWLLTVARPQRNWTRLVRRSLVINRWGKGLDCVGRYWCDCCIRLIWFLDGIDGRLVWLFRRLRWSLRLVDWQWRVVSIDGLNPWGFLGFDCELFWWISYGRLVWLVWRDD